MHLVGKEGGEPHWLSASSQPPRDQHQDGGFCAGATGRLGLGMQDCREGGLPCHSPLPPVALHSSLKLGQRGQIFAPDLMQSQTTTVPGERVSCQRQFLSARVTPGGMLRVWETHHCIHSPGAGPPPLWASASSSARWTKTVASSMTLRIYEFMVCRI